MKGIDSKRQKGFINLNEHFDNILGQDNVYYDIQDLYEKGLIEVEATGISDKFWILDPKTGEKTALYKEQNGIYTCYAELFAEEIAKILGFETAHYDLAIFNGREGVISYNFLKEDEQYCSGFDVMSDFYEKVICDDSNLAELYDIDIDNDTIEEALDKLNNLDDIWSILEDKYENYYYKQQIVYSIMDKLVDKLMFDILTVSIDDHAENWALVDNRLAPLFDNERILNMHHEERNINSGELNDKKLLLTADNSKIDKPLEVLQHFLNISSSDYKDRFIEKMNALEKNVEYVPLNVSKRTEHDVPKEIKNYFLNTMYNHLDNINLVLKNNNKGSK